MNKPPNLRCEPTCIDCTHYESRPHDTPTSYCQKYNVSMWGCIYICDDYTHNKSYDPKNVKFTKLQPEYQI